MPFSRSTTMRPRTAWRRTPPATAAHGVRGSIRVYGAEPAEAGDAAAGFHAGRMVAPFPTHTIADGLRSGVSLRTFAAMRAHLTDLATCSEAAIVRAMRLMWEH